MIYTPMFMPDTPVFLKQLKAAGVDIPVVTSDGNDTPDILTAGPEALDGMILTTFAYPSRGPRWPPSMRPSRPAPASRRRR